MTDMPPNGTDLAFAELVAREAGALLLRYQQQGFTVAHKGVIDLVTTADRESEHLIVAAIAARFPSHAIITEEAAPRPSGSAYTWYIDPLDGTTNFVHHHPNFAVSLALYDGLTAVLGVIYDPLRDEMFSALLGRGASLNGRPLSVSGTASLIESLVSSGFPYDVLDSGRNIEAYLELTLLTRGVRISGAAAIDLAYVACGRLDGYWEPEILPWDGAAGALIVREAGGRITDLSGADWQPSMPGVAATNGRLHPLLLQRVA